MRGIWRAIVVLVTLASCGGDKSEDALGRARAEAKKIAPDAQLVAVDFSGFGFAVGNGGIPDMTRSGPPQVAVFNFYSPSGGKGFRIDVDINRPPISSDAQKAMEQQGYKDLRVEPQGQVPFVPYTLPLPDDIGDFNRAVEAAKASIAADCAADTPPLSTGCALTQDVELHMNWAGPQDGNGKPVWTVSFGQNPKTLETVRRKVLDGSSSLYEGGDAQATDVTGADAQPLQQVDLKAKPDFDQVWPAVLAEVRKQDPLYTPYAASLVTYLSDVHDAGGAPIVSEVHIQFARLTPSLLWDEMEAHVAWRQGAEDDAVLFFSAPRRHFAPADAKPVTLDSAALPQAGPALAALLKNFPEGYTEVRTTWSQGCEDIMSFVVGLRMWRCGVYLPNEEHSDLVFLWLTRQGNPFWQSERAPIASEYDLVASNAPKDGWTWWTRVKHPDYWKYFLTDAKQGKPAAEFCTNPNDGTNAIQISACPR
jgi:hypothetical protein